MVLRAKARAKEKGKTKEKTKGRVVKTKARVKWARVRELHMQAVLR